MRLTLLVLLCLLNTGCALFRADRDEPVEPRRAEQPKAEVELKPSEALKPKSLEIASPVTDVFSMRASYFPASVSTVFQFDRARGVPGTLLSAEDDLGLDDRIDQGRLEVDMRMKKRHHLRVDFFKLSRFSQQPLAEDIAFGDFDFPAGTIFRTNLDWRVFTISHSYSFFTKERWEMGGGLGIHIIQVQAEGGTPGTLRKEEDSEVAIFPTLGINGAFRISKRWSVTGRANYFSASPDNFDGSMADYHADIQYRMRKNFSFGLGYTKLATHLTVDDADQPIRFDLDVSGPELFFRASF
jgi:hypothetical protein